MPKPIWRATASFALVGMIASSFAPAFCEPAHPSWWSSRGVTNSNPPNNKAVATVSQVKHISTMARAELESLLPGGAGFSLPFPDPPESPDTTWYQKQRNVLTLAQLKACAYPVYQKLNSISTVWVKQQLEANGLTLGNTFHQDSNGYYYPWNPATPVEINKSVATLAQIKLVFCLRFDENLDGDGAADLLELASLGSTAANVSAAQAQQLQSSGAAPGADEDNDGLTNAEEVVLGTNFDNADSDNDGVNDGEDASPLDALVDWKRTSHPNFAAIELDISNIDDVTLDDLSDKGTVLLSRVDNQTATITERIVVGELTAHSFGVQPAGNTVGSIATALYGDKVLGYKLISGLQQEGLWDPLDGTFTLFTPPVGYHGDMLDVRGTLSAYDVLDTTTFETVIGTPHGNLANSGNNPPAATIEQNGNILGATLYEDDPANPGQLIPVAGYWRFQDVVAGVPASYGPKVSIQEDVVTSPATVMQGTDHWNLVPLTTGLMVAKNNGGFQKSDKLKNLTGDRVPVGMTSHGWLGAKGEIWANGKWYLLKDVISDDLESATLWAINDNGLAVAKIKKTGGNPTLALLVPTDIVPDYNRDGKIDAFDRGKVIETNPWRFWDNDDDDKIGEERRDSGDDTPGQSIADQDGNDLKVDGVRDLIDFFPLHLDLKQTLEVLPSADYKYVLKHETEAIKFFEFPAVLLDGSDPENAPHSHMRNISQARIFKEKNLQLASTQGTELSAVMLDAFKDGEGVILCEAVRNRTEQPLVLEIIKRSDNTSVTEIEFALSISPIGDMYRTKFFSPNDPEGDGEGYTMPGSPTNWPDEDRNGKHFVFVHGYSVSGSQSQGWHAEIFKRLYWSGSNAMFTGISWNGNESQWIALGEPTPDYWRNVINAFQTSEDVASFSNQLPGKKAIAAHSLGNMVVSSAIKDHGLDVETYFMVDAAVAMEAYQESENDLMRPTSWSGLESRLWPTEWYKLFLTPATDGRRSLTWRMRFGTFPHAYNCYSWGEQVLRNNESGLGTNGIPPTNATVTHKGLRSWVIQEMSKGTSFIGGGGLFHNGQGGWKFNHSATLGGPYSHFNSGNGLHYMYSVQEANAIPVESLKTATYFKEFNDDDIIDPVLGSIAAVDASLPGITAKAELLAEAIPAYSFAAGANELEEFGEARNISMMSFRTDANEWPPDGIYPNHRDWLHSDIRDVGYLHNYKVYDKFVEISNLK